MKDTSDQVHGVMIAMMKRKSGEERMKIVATMFETAIQLILESSRGPLDDAEAGATVFMRFYGHDFIPEEKEKILAHLSR